jgi:hypothetical protein
MSLMNDPLKMIVWRENIIPDFQSSKQLCELLNQQIYKKLFQFFNPIINIILFLNVYLSHLIGVLNSNILN